VSSVRLVIRPGAVVDGEVRVPGDKSIAHRWLILAATARGASAIAELPASLDVRSTARCLSRLAPQARPGLDAWTSKVTRGAEDHGFTWDAEPRVGSTLTLELEGEGLEGLVEAGSVLDCGNSGTSMRLLAGVLAATPFTSTLDGDASLRRRPMERVAEPLRLLGADVRTTGGHAPVAVVGARLVGITYATPVPSAQVKGAVLLAGCAADGRTEIREAAPTRDHTERALAALGGRVETSPGRVAVERFQHGGFDARVPGDVSSAAFLVGAAAVTGGRIEILDVGLNPTRTRFLEVFRRMGVDVETVERGRELGEPIGDIVARGPRALSATTVAADELPLVIDEVPVLAAAAAHADGETSFEGAAELRVKESDRLSAIAASLRALGSHALAEGDDLVVVGGGVSGGRASSAGDHRMAMAIAVAGLAARTPVEIEDAGAADVSFPGFANALRVVGADVEAGA
jgi:3-phosphoshikimate 1-carboxyvinyltransferase